MRKRRAIKKILEFARRMRKFPTLAEKKFWERVRNNGFRGQKFYRQYIIKHAEILENESYFIADFYCHSARLIVEIDGEIHDFQLEYDQLREETLKEMGFTILRFTNNEVLHHWEKVEKKLLRHLN